MAIALVSLELRGSRRVRAIFTGALGSGAFTSTSYYSVTASDGGLNPLHVVAVFAIANSSNAVEMALDTELTGGSLYSIAFAAVPGADASTFTGSQLIRQALDLQALPNVEPETQDVNLLLYGRDLLFRGDFVQSPSGDLATVAGRPNWLGAMGRRFGSEGVNWDPTYGARADEAVEAPAPLAPAFAGSLAAQARLDDRTSQASVSLQLSSLDPAGFVFAVAIVGRDGLATQTVRISPPSV